MRTPISTLALVAALISAAVASLPSEAVAHDVAVPSALPQGERSLEASPTPPQIERGEGDPFMYRPRCRPPVLDEEVRDSLRGERDLRQIEVSVQGNVVTLTGSVQTFWSKDQAIKRTLAIEGVATVVSELEIPVAEDDNDVAQDVARAIQRYPHYTVWDHIEGSVNEGVVLLSGSVAPDQDKARDIFERVAKVNGVQDLQSDIRTLSPSRRDQELRQAIGYRVFSSEHFERFASMPNPPFHIIVDNSTVTLVGYVQSAIELHEIQRIVAQTQGIRP